MSGTWIRITADGAVREHAAPDDEPAAALCLLLGYGLPMSVDVAGGVVMVVDEGYDSGQLPVNPVAHLTASLLGPGLEELTRGSVVFATARSGAGLTGVALDKARDAASLAASLRPLDVRRASINCPPPSIRGSSCGSAGTARPGGSFVCVGDPSRDPDDDGLSAPRRDEGIDTVARLQTRAGGHLEVGPMLARLLRLDRAVAEFGGHTLAHQLADAASPRG